MRDDARIVLSYAECVLLARKAIDEQRALSAQSTLTAEQRDAALAAVQNDDYSYDSNESIKDAIDTLIANQTTQETLTQRVAISAASALMTTCERDESCILHVIARVLVNMTSQAVDYDATRHDSYSDDLAKKLREYVEEIFDEADFML